MLSANQHSKEAGIMSNGAGTGGEEIPAMALSNDAPAWEPYIFRCAACGTSEGVATISLRKYGGIVGLVFACAECGPRMGGHSIRMSEIAWNRDGP